MEDVTVATKRSKMSKLKATHVYNAQGDTLGYDPHTGFLYIGMEQYSCSDVRGFSLDGQTLVIQMVHGEHTLTTGLGPMDEFLGWVQYMLREHHADLIRKANAGFNTMQAYAYTPDVTCAYYVGGSDKVVRVQRGMTPSAQYLDYKIAPADGRRKFREECTTLIQRETLSERELAIRAATREHIHSPDHAFFRFNDSI